MVHFADSLVTTVCVEEIQPQFQPIKRTKVDKTNLKELLLIVLTKPSYQAIDHGPMPTLRQKLGKDLILKLLLEEEQVETDIVVATQAPLREV